MNRQKKTIDWADYTWNPISGCQHGCSYCYLRRMEKRFPGMMQCQFHPERLAQPVRVKKSSRIFVGSSGDMWGEWVHNDHISAVFDAIAKANQHTYFFLTKNPKRFFEYYILNFQKMLDVGHLLREGGGGVWWGTSVDGTEKTRGNIREMENMTSFDRLFVSFEPLLAPIEPDLTCLDWLIIGGDSTPGAKKPPDSWAEKIIRNAKAFTKKQNIPVWIKDNYGYHTRMKEF